MKSGAMVHIVESYGHLLMLSLMGPNEVLQLPRLSRDGTIEWSHKDVGETVPRVAVLRASFGAPRRLLLERVTGAVACGHRGGSRERGQWGQRAVRPAFSLAVRATDASACL